MSDGQFLNTDRELWREPKVDGSPGDYYSPKIHVTLEGSIGINVGGTVIVMPLRQWHSAAAALLAERERVIRLRSALQSANCYMADPAVAGKLGEMIVFGAAALAEAGEE